MADLSRTVSSRLRKRRSELKLSQAALAERVGVSVELVSRIERGRCLPSIGTLVGLCDALSVSPNELLGYEARPERDADRLAAMLRAMSPGQRREVERIAEALASYERRK